MGSFPDESRQYPSVFCDLLIDTPPHVREGCSQSGQRFLEPCESGPLAWQWNLFHHVFMKKLSGCGDFSRREHAVEKLPDSDLVLFDHGDS
jgi:hypothetical protein